MSCPIRKYLSMPKSGSVFTAVRSRVEKSRWALPMDRIYEHAKAQEEEEAGDQTAGARRFAGRARPFTDELRKREESECNGNENNPGASFSSGPNCDPAAKRKKAGDEG